MKARGSWLVAGLAVGVIALAGVAAHTRAADPGSKDDPLATVGYVERYAQFTRVELAAGTSLRLGLGAEMVIIDPAYESIEVAGLDGLRDDLVNLTAGECAGSGSLTAYQHYLNGSSHDLFLRPACGVTVLLRGEWK